MDVVDPVGIQFPTLPGGPFDAQLSGILIRVALHDLSGQRFRNVTVEGTWHHRQLVQFSHRFDARNDRHRDTHLSGFLHEGEIFVVVEEQLSDRILCAQLLLLQQIQHVPFQIRRLLVFLGIAGHTDVEPRSRVLDGRPIGKESLVEPLHLPYQVRRMTMSAGRRFKHPVVLRLVATQQQQIGDAEELQVEQFILYIIDGSPAADDMRLDGHPESLLDGRRYGDGARPAAHLLTFVASVAQFAVDKLAVVRCDIDECRVQFAQLLDVAKQPLGARPLQWGQHLKRELMLVLIPFNKICNSHNRMQSYKKNLSRIMFSHYLYLLRLTEREFFRIFATV